MPVKEITSDLIKEWLFDLEVGPRTTKNYLAVISELFRYACQKKYIAHSPIDSLTDIDRKELCGNQGHIKEPSILTPQEAEKLLLAAHEEIELNLLGAVTLGLFCGIRTEELKRLDWKNVKDDQDSPIVTITGEIAKKRRIRHVDIPDNALSWLSLCSQRIGTVSANNNSSDHRKRFQKLLQVSGFRRKKRDGSWESDWSPNAMRHSFGIYHYALHGNPLETSRLLGHKASDQVLFDHYRALASKKDGEAYFSINPPVASSKIVKIR